MQSKNIRLLLLFLFIFSNESCNHQKEGVSNSKTYKFHTEIPLGTQVSGYAHYIYIGDYDVKTKKDTLHLLDKAMMYVDTVKYATPVTSIAYINSIENFPKAMDDQDANEIRKHTIFYVSFNEDSLLKRKYSINGFYNTDKK
ncbi:hypothetical protein QM480_24370 [Flectobacillus sp. DC10W]|uniref:Lipoprotein n=1 Tax=Flectobacillus longus TaxID=2984207 RepID=A0ABT6YV55_9BACT|nr:hypothetical protein [Flectobacillus longus]MDI9867502.1 hypothetical protein [Flectobacillus longus]